jgi:hypothetical protein
LAQVTDLKIPKEILQHKKHFYKPEFDRFQEDIPFKQMPEYKDLLPEQIMITIEY